VGINISEEYTVSIFDVEGIQVWEVVVHRRIRHRNGPWRIGVVNVNYKWGKGEGTIWVNENSRP
jgi:hypothetical protein